MRKLAFVYGIIGAFAATSAFAAPIKLNYTGTVKLVSDNTGQLGSISAGNTTVSGSIIYDTSVLFGAPYGSNGFTGKRLMGLNFIQSANIKLNTSSGASEIGYQGINPIIGVSNDSPYFQYLESATTSLAYNYATSKYDEGFIVQTGYGSACLDRNTNCHPSALYTENLDLSGTLLPFGLNLEFSQSLNDPNSAFGLLDLPSFTEDFVDFAKIATSAKGSIGYVNEGVSSPELIYSFVDFDITSFSFEAVTSPVTSDVPEAPTVAVMSMGLLGLGLARRRKAKKLAA